jgi:hypothetical protein
MLWYTMSSYSLDRLLLVISTCNVVEDTQCSWGEVVQQVGEWFLRHDKELSYTSLDPHHFLAQKDIPAIFQPLYSSDLTPSDFWLFPTLKMCLKGSRFAATEDVKLNAMARLRKIPKEAFHRCF